MRSAVYLRRMNDRTSFHAITRALNGFRGRLTSCPTSALRRAVTHFRSAPGHCTGFRGTLTTSTLNHTGSVTPRITFVRTQRGSYRTLLSLLTTNRVPLHIARGSAGVGGILVSTTAKGNVYIVSLSAIVPNLSTCSFNSSVHANTGSYTRSRPSRDGIRFSLRLCRIFTGKCLSATKTSVDPTRGGDLT